MANSWTILIVVLVVAMAVGPVMLMQPTGRQRRLAKLRQNALEQGVRVSVTTWPQSAGQCPAGTMRYSLAWGHDQPAVRQRVEQQGGQHVVLVRKNYRHELHVAGLWQPFPEGVCVHGAVPVFIQQRPPAESIVSLGYDGGGVFVDWSEQPSSDLTTIKTTLESLRAGF